MEARSSRTARYSSAGLASSSRVDVGPLSGEEGGGLGPAPWRDPVPGPGNLFVACFCRVRGVRLVVGGYDEAFPRGIVDSGAGVVGVAKPVVRGVEESLEHHWSGTPEKSHSAYPCKVTGGSSLAEP
jgi:hypothetical protein